MALGYFSTKTLKDTHVKTSIEMKFTKGLIHILGLAKTMLHEICVSGTVVGPLLTQKIPQLHIHKPKTMVVETLLVIFV